MQWWRSGKNLPEVKGLWTLQLLGKAVNTAAFNFDDRSYNGSQWTPDVQKNWAGGGGPTSGNGNPSLYLTDWPAESTTAILPHWFTSKNQGSLTSLRYKTHPYLPAWWYRCHLHRPNADTRAPIKVDGSNTVKCRILSLIPPQSATRIYFIALTLKESTNPLPMKFEEYLLDHDILDGIEDAGFIECMPVQDMTLPHALAGRDVFVQSQTGSGKTAAFLVPMFQHLLGRHNTDKGLIIAPTRELAIQIEEEGHKLGCYLDLRIGCFYGGMGYAKQDALLAEGVDIYVGTPGRLIDYGRSGKIDFSAISMLVIDEADRLFDMGFLPDLHDIMRHMRPSSERQTMLFSATLPTGVRRLAREFMKDPVSVEITPEKVTVETVTQELYHISEEDKFSLLLGLLQREKPVSALIFTNTKDAAEHVAERLVMNGYDARHISGDLSQERRIKVLNQIKTGKLPILVATDVAARGLHIDALELVINYDLPDYPENYVHRVGRTARAGSTGKAISLACQAYCTNLPSIETLIGFKIPAFITEGLLSAIDHGKGHFRDRSSLRSRPMRPARGRGRPEGRGKFSRGHGAR